MKANKAYRKDGKWRDFNGEDIAVWEFVKSLILFFHVEIIWMRINIGNSIFDVFNFHQYNSKNWRTMNKLKQMLRISDQWERKKNVKVIVFENEFLFCKLVSDDTIVSM